MKKDSIVADTGIVGGLTLISRVLGFIRDLLVARFFGAGLYADAFFVAFRIPNLLRSFVAEGALTSAFVPVISDQLIKSHTHAKTTLRSTCGLLLLVTTIISALGVLFAPQIVALFAPGFKLTAGKYEICVTLTQIMFPYIMCVSLVALLNAALNSVKIFGASSWAQVWMNVVLIAGAIIASYLSEKNGVVILATSVILGGVIQVLWQIPALKRAGFSIWPRRPFLTPATREIIRLMAPALIGATIYQFLIYINTVMASALEAGSVAWLYYADRLAQLPIGVFTIALASVMLPTLSRSRSSGNTKDFARQLINSLRYTSFVVIPMAVALVYWAKPLVSLVYEGRAFTAYSVEKTALALQAYALGIWAVSCHSMLARAFLAHKDTVTTTLVGLMSLVLNVFLALSFMGQVQPSESTLIQTIVALQSLLPFEPWSLGHAGLALSSSLASFGSCLALVLLIKRHIVFTWSDFVLASLKATVASGLTLLVLEVLPFNNNHLGFILLEVPAGIILYLGFSKLLKSKEFSETWTLIK